jgi:predicted RNase H-like HicB family nuclease
MKLSVTAFSTAIENAKVNGLRLCTWVKELAMSLQRTIKAVIRPGEQSGFVAECLEIPVVTQGATLDEVSANLREAVALHLEGEDLVQLGLAASPFIIVTFELEALPASA